MSDRILALVPHTDNASLDAAELSLLTGDRVKVSSRRGEVIAYTFVTERASKGVISMTFHFTETRTNLITNSACDPVAKIPETKVCAVKLEKVV